MTQPVWNTTAGSIGTYPSLVPMVFQFSASAQLPAVTVTYSFLSGSLPSGLTLSESGLLSGIPALTSIDTNYTFVIRATDNYQDIRDRTFSILISGVASPSFTTPTGSILTTLDSIWIEKAIQYSNPISSNPVSIRVVQGALPPGVEINEAGLIRGYADPPIAQVNLGIVSTTGTVTSSATNEITCLSTTGFLPNRPIKFIGTVFGGIIENQTYYVKSVDSETTFTVSATQGGPVFALVNDTGFMSILLPNVSVGQPTIRTYSFTLQLDSPLGSDIESYFITVINQNTPVSQGGPGYPPNSRLPTIYNTRPPTYNIESNIENYGYYVLPPIGTYTPEGVTYPTSVLAYIGNFQSGDYFAFKIIGKDFDDNGLTYVAKNNVLPPGLTLDASTGWIKGYPSIANDSIAQFTFAVAAYKTINPAIITPFINFSFRLSNNLDGDITWVTPSDLGEIFNGTVSTKSVLALAESPLSYRITNGSLPPNLTLETNGEITGEVAYQPTETFLNPGVETTFTFTVEAFSEQFPTVISSSKTFTITVLQQYIQPTDTLYIKCAPSIADRFLLDTLLENDTLIPPSSLYRPTDPNFGKASNVTYVHAYGIYASNFDDYIAAVTKNHYWRNITLGEIETAVARNEAGDIIYEVVFSRVIDNLINPQGISIQEEIYWPRSINLNQGPWYTSVTNIFTSYIYNDNQGNPQFYTSLTPGVARILYPNSLPNMRQRVGQVLGQEYNFRLLPSWMTSQQLNGSTLGFTPAWVICYTKPGLSEAIKNNIQNNWKDPIGNVIKLNVIDFQIDRFSVDKSMTYNYDTGLSPPAWTGLPSATPVPDPLDSKDFYVLFPRKTILPTQSQI